MGREPLGHDGPCCSHSELGPGVFSPGLKAPGGHGVSGFSPRHPPPLAQRLACGGRAQALTFNPGLRHGVDGASTPAETSVPSKPDQPSPCVPRPLPSLHFDNGHGFLPAPHWEDASIKKRVKTQQASLAEEAGSGHTRRQGMGSASGSSPGSSLHQPPPAAWGGRLSWAGEWNSGELARQGRGCAQVLSQGFLGRAERGPRALEAARPPPQLRPGFAVAV